MSLDRRQFNQLLFLGAASFALPGGASVAVAAEGAPVAGGTLNWAYYPDPSSLIAINTTSGTGQAIGPKVNEGLLTYDYDLNAQPLLATEWSISDDGLRYTFKLREGVKWHDGKDFTSEDVAFTILRLKEAHPRGRITYQNVTAVETPDPHTAIIVLSKPAPYLITAVSSSESPIVPKHVYETFKPEEQPKLEQTIGTGPFILKEWVPGSHLIFDRNPDYWDKPKPYLDRVVLRVILDPSARAAALETGEIDIGANPVPLADIERLKANPNLVVDTKTYAYSGPQQQLFFNYENEKLTKRDVRLAIAHSIDLQKLVEIALYGYAQVSPSPVSTALPKWYDPSIKAREYDTAKAEQLLDSAGHPRGADGIRFKLRLAYNAFLTPAYADFIKQQLAVVGIDAEILKLDLATFLKTVYTDRAWDIVVESLSNTFDPTLGVQRAYWSKNFKIGLVFSNASHYANPEVDQILEAAAIEPDEAKRRELWYKFQHIIHEDVVSVDLVAAGAQIVANKKVRNFAPGAEGINNSFGQIWLDPNA
ncbi:MULTISPECIES: ABC transporter substrate-binding protein [unclassified Mesorhizobium]|uniref:ABC transporter substrate-binding protein n=1 Tax=unclassified Mesorhizobium TaxID=325217 RepID=UPI000FCA999F|nr:MULTISPECIES: ABC transporter substrate-binding protein [unclassified Mesorhizobium]RUW30390.1 ABC transporter substrate-binding protein [Mesorhizobium sp. M1E.F.Ca.ET.041.01.1.1]RWD91851.1 MAG: ABC transporter substrate-binding protein [Mesorhizobium sp.]RWD95792.1 MAG: ABC transporter substrate-binding protein [Mesorhizobium sp.]TIV50478.1 MAG: ABC transporter substrate-binding protein [Mesorhizobium sp.]